MTPATLCLVKPGDAPAHALSLDALEDQGDTVEITAERHRRGLPLETALAEAYRAGHEHGETEATARHAVLAHRALAAVRDARADEIAARRSPKAGA